MITEKCKQCTKSDCPLKQIKAIHVPENLPEKYNEILKFFRDIETMAQYGLDMELNDTDRSSIINIVTEAMVNDPGTKAFSKKMRQRLENKRFHYVYKKSNVFFNFIKGKRHHALLSNFLKTLTVPTNKGQLHFLSGSNFTICAVSHFFDRFIQRNELDLSRPRSMDLLYRRLLDKPIKISIGPEDDFFKLNEGVAIGKAFGDPPLIFVFMTYITDDQLTEKQKYLMNNYTLFHPKLRNIKI